jgi:hypothetical protein
MIPYVFDLGAAARADAARDRRRDSVPLEMESGDDEPK